MFRHVEPMHGPSGGVLRETCRNHPLRAAHRQPHAEHVDNWQSHLCGANGSTCAVGAEKDEANDQW